MTNKFQPGDVIEFMKSPEDRDRHRATVVQVFETGLLRVQMPDATKCVIRPDDSTTLIERATPEATQAPPTVLMLDPNTVQSSPWQPRSLLDEPEMQELTADVKANGILQPVSVRKIGDTYQLVFGHRRREAARRAGVLLPAIVREVTDQESAERALVENLVRADLNPLDAARGYERLCREFGLTQEQVASKVHRSQPSVANAMRLLQLPDSIQDAIAKKLLTGSHGVVLLSLDNADDQRAFGVRAVDNAWSVKKLEEAIAEFKESIAPPKLDLSQPETPRPTVDTDKRLLLAALTVEPQRIVDVANAAGLDLLRADMAARELIAEGRLKTHPPGCWAKVPDASPVGAHDTPSPAERTLERDVEPRPETVAPRSAPPAPPAATAPTPKAATPTPATKPAAKPEPKATAPAIADEKQWIQVDKARLLKLQDAGLTIEAIFEAVEKLLEIGGPFGLEVPDMLTSIDAYFNGDGSEDTDGQPTA